MYGVACPPQVVQSRLYVLVDPSEGIVGVDFGSEWIRQGDKAARRKLLARGFDSHQIHRVSCT